MSQANPKAYKLRGSFIKAGIIFFLDAYCFSQGVIAAVTLFVAVMFLLLAALTVLKDKALCRTRLIRAGIYTASALAVFAVMTWNNVGARARAERLIHACDQYKSKYQEYPETLNALVPEFLPRVPQAKYTFMSNNFYYFSGSPISSLSKPARHSIMYAVYPPFYRAIYHMEDKSWGYID